MTDITRPTPGDGLTGVLAELAEEMGSVAGALRLAQHYGGLVIYVPGKPRPKQVIARTCGLDVARALSKLYKNEQVLVPLGSTDSLKQNRILKMEGSAAQVARAVGCTIRHVRWVRARQKRPVALPLFDGIDGEDNDET